MTAIEKSSSGGSRWQWPTIERESALIFSRQVLSFSLVSLYAYALYINNEVMYTQLGPLAGIGIMHYFRQG